MLEMLQSATFANDPPLACATCMGDAGSLINQAAGYAIAFMLVMLAVVLGALIKFMGYLSKQDKSAAPAPISDDPTK